MTDDIKVEKKNRLVIVFYSPWLQREQLMRAIPMEGKSGKMITNHSKNTLKIDFFRRRYC